MSANSQASGKRGAAQAPSSKAGRAAEPVSVTLEHSRWRHFAWTLIGFLLGSMVIAKIGSAGKVIGAGLMLLAGYHGYRFTMTLLKPSGTIKVDSTHVELPLGLCRGKTATFPMAELRHAFLLRRAVSWMSTGPLLVIETGEQVFAYPRDWFASESAQRRIARAIQVHQGKKSSAT